MGLRQFLLKSDLIPRKPLGGTDSTYQQRFPFLMQTAVPSGRLFLRQWSLESLNDRSSDRPMSSKSSNRKKSLHRKLPGCRKRSKLQKIHNSKIFSHLLPYILEKLVIIAFIALENDLRFREGVSVSTQIPPCLNRDTSVKTGLFQQNWRAYHTCLPQCQYITAIMSH